MNALGSKRSEHVLIKLCANMPMRQKQGQKWNANASISDVLWLCFLEYFFIRS